VQGLRLEETINRGFPRKRPSTIRRCVNVEHKPVWSRGGNSLGADDEQQLRERFERAAELLPFEFTS
jgi:hypothetical protein